MASSSCNESHYPNHFQQGISKLTCNDNNILTIKKNRDEPDTIQNYNCSITDMNDERDRLKTFTDWPKELSDINTELMAKSGLYYTKYKDKVICQFCHLALTKWSEDDNIIEIHLKHSPSCPFLRRRITQNIPIDSNELDRILPPESIDVTGLDDYLVNDNVNNDLNIKYPEYIYPQARLNSFDGWPTALNQKPKDLSDAGFFYTKLGDKVLCFSCNLGLNGWEPTDIPIEEHTRWSNNCDYIIKLKGTEYIQSIIDKYENMTNNENVVEEPESNDDTNIDKLCKICLDKVIDTVFLPCGHIFACAQCGYILNNCPMCRKPIENKKKIYYS